MSVNLSKQKCDDLLSKIKAIRTYITAVPQDENFGSLLTYLSDLEKGVNGKKYGLVFKEHQGAIDEVPATHTPVLTEAPALLIDNGGEGHPAQGQHQSIKRCEKLGGGRVTTS